MRIKSKQLLSKCRISIFFRLIKNALSVKQFSNNKYLKTLEKLEIIKKKHVFRSLQSITKLHKADFEEKSRKFHDKIYQFKDLNFKRKLFGLLLSRNRSK